MTAGVELDELQDQLCQRWGVLDEIVARLTEEGRVQDARALREHFTQHRFGWLQCAHPCQGELHLRRHPSGWGWSCSSLPTSRLSRPPRWSTDFEGGPVDLVMHLDQCGREEALSLIAKRLTSG